MEEKVKCIICGRKKDRDECVEKDKRFVCLDCLDKMDEGEE